MPMSLKGLSTSGLLKSLFVPPSAAEEGGKLSGDTPRPGSGYRPCTPFSATFEKPCKVKQRD